MTDRYYALTVTLNRDYRDDDAEAILQAIRMIKGVRGVTPLVADSSTYWAQERAMLKFREALLKMLDNPELGQ